MDDKVIELDKRSLSGTRERVLDPIKDERSSLRSQPVHIRSNSRKQRRIICGTLFILVTLGFLGWASYGLSGQWVLIEKCRIYNITPDFQQQTCQLDAYKLGLYCGNQIHCEDMYRIYDVNCTSLSVTLGWHHCNTTLKYYFGHIEDNKAKYNYFVQHKAECIYYRTGYYCSDPFRRYPHNNLIVLCILIPIWIAGILILICIGVRIYKNN